MIKYYVYNNIETMDQPDKKILKVVHNAGYFSNMTIRLMDIMAFMKEHKCLPDEVDSSVQFAMYKDDPTINLIPYYIEHNDEPIKFKLPKEANKDCMAIQWDDYRKLDLKALAPIMNKYFKPGSYVMDKYNHLKSKYNLGEYISVFYRGNDKKLETETASYDNFFKKCQEIREIEPNLPFLVMPDECHFLKTFRKQFDNVISFSETPCTDDNNSSVSFKIPMGSRSEYGATFNASAILMGEGKHLITHSGNCGLWASLYRNNPNNIHQIYKNEWYK